MSSERGGKERKKERVLCYKTCPRNALMNRTSKKDSGVRYVKRVTRYVAFVDELVTRATSFYLICEVIGGIISEQMIIDTSCPSDIRIITDNEI